MGGTASSMMDWIVRCFACGKDWYPRGPMVPQVCECGKPAYVMGIDRERRIATVSPEGTGAQLHLLPPRTIYLSGPMTGRPNFNAEEFAKYAEKFRAKGWEVLSPPELDGGDYSQKYEEYIIRDLIVLIQKRPTGVYLLPGWWKSRGAMLEKHVAQMIGIPIYDAETEEPWNETVTQEAFRLVHGERGDTYSHPLDDFGRTAGVLNSLFHHKLKAPLTEEDVAIFMVAVKLSRLMNSPDHRDSVVDVAGYAECYQMVREERERRAAALGGNVYG
jgi:hypothetical protein